MDIEQHFGVKLSAVVAGLVGAVVSLGYMRELTPGRAFLYILTGTACAAYGTPLVVKWLAVSGATENGVAFLTGVVGMNILAGVFKVSERFKREPVKTFHALKNAPLDALKEKPSTESKDV
ncbi:peptidase M48 [Roseibium sediminis]|uniref:peptidase M48 n=1 Tax=Roseibium sediminis TaxID=1775174 RepID=UPI00123E0DE8|nr:peptidase M48 [Roseibium sediminis]